MGDSDAKFYCTDCNGGGIGRGGAGTCNKCGGMGTESHLPPRCTEGLPTGLTYGIRGFTESDLRAGAWIWNYKSSESHILLDDGACQCGEWPNWDEGRNYGLLVRESDRPLETVVTEPEVKDILKTGNREDVQGNLHRRAADELVKHTESLGLYDDATENLAGESALQTPLCDDCELTRIEVIRKYRNGETERANRLRDEVVAMRPVVEAAERWTDTRMPSALGQLADAVEAYREVTG